MYNAIMLEEYLKSGLSLVWSFYGTEHLHV